MLTRPQFAKGPEQVRGIRTVWPQGQQYASQFLSWEILPRRDLSEHVFSVGRQRRGQHFVAELHRHTARRRRANCEFGKQRNFVDKYPRDRLRQSAALNDGRYNPADLALD